MDWWLIPAHFCRRLKWEDCEAKASLGYLVSLRTAWATQQAEAKKLLSAPRVRSWGRKLKAGNDLVEL